MLTEQEVRVKAIELGVQLIAAQGGYHNPREAAQAAAEHFERYIKTGRFAR